MEAVECRYRGRVIGWLVEGHDGFLRYERIHKWCFKWPDRRVFDFLLGSSEYRMSHD